MEKVFISYSHKDEGWVRNWLLPKLEEAGLTVHIDFRDFEIGLPVLLNMEKAIEQCEKTIVVLTPDWVKSEYTNFEAILLQTRDPSNIQKKIIPIMLIECELPRRLEILTWSDFREPDNREPELERLVGQMRKDLKVKEEPIPKPVPIDEVNIDISRLPDTGYTLFGRAKEFKLLDNAWESVETCVVSLVAYGGTGKSTLVNKWLEKLRWDNYRGAKKVFGWSFYSQGTSERVTSADKFISEALEWFGDEDPTKGSPWDKGQRLADLIRKQKTLLVLDGLEPLQSGYEYEKGKIKDPALSILVTQLARKNNGLCVITTREKVAELERFDKGVIQINLEQISKEAGRALLRVGGVQGTDEELEAASEEFGNHALAINLLASYIHGIEGHHISNAKEIPDLDIPEEKGRYPRRVIAAFEKRFGEGPQIQALRIMGLFDRPAHVDAIKAVRKGTEISGLTDKIKSLTEGKWFTLLDELRGCKLLARKSEHNPDIIDCHPLVREHFGERLQEERPEAWKEAHGRLYEYYKGLPEKLYGKELPDTLEEMEPLFAAVTHGCLAGRHQETFVDVYWGRITRGNQYYIWRKFGALGADLAAVSCFFERPWREPASGLKDENKAVLLAIAGFDLKALGRFIEATEPTRASMEEGIKHKNWNNTSRGANNLSELYHELGDVERAVEYARKAVGYAEKIGSLLELFKSESRLANSLLGKGNILETEELFKQAEIKCIKYFDQKYRFLVSLEGFWFCDLLLDQGKYKEVQERANYSLDKWSNKENVILDIALDKISLGRAYMLEAMSQGRMMGDGRETTDDKGWKEGLGKAEDFLDEAVDGLRNSGNQEDIPFGLLARAELKRCHRSWEKAWGDLEQAREISERGEMNLFLANYHLEAARVCLAQGRSPEARGHYEEAGKRVEEMGYHRRDPEVLLIQAELEIVEGNKEQAQKTLTKAKKRIDEMGCHRWDVEAERISDLLLTI